MYSLVYSCWHVIIAQYFVEIFFYLDLLYIYTSCMTLILTMLTFISVFFFFWSSGWWMEKFVLDFLRLGILRRYVCICHQLILCLPTVGVINHYFCADLLGCFCFCQSIAYVCWLKFLMVRLCEMKIAVLFIFIYCFQNWLKVH